MTSGLFRVITTALVLMWLHVPDPAHAAGCDGNDVCYTPPVSTSHLFLFGVEIARHDMQMQVCRNAASTLVTKMNLLRNTMSGVGIGTMDWHTENYHHTAPNQPTAWYQGDGCIGVDIPTFGTFQSVGDRIQFDFWFSGGTLWYKTSNSKLSVGVHDACP